MKIKGRNRSKKRGQSIYKPMIEAYISKHPGSSFSELRDIFQLPDSTIRYHLKDLEKKGKIISDSNKRIYYPSKPEGERTLNKTQQQLSYAIKQHPGIIQKELSIITKIKPLTIRNNVPFLIEKEIIYTKKIGREVHYYYRSPEEIERIKMSRFVTKFLQRKIDEETFLQLRQGLIEAKLNYF